MFSYKEKPYRLFLKGNYLKKIIGAFLLGFILAATIAIQAYWTDWPVTVLTPAQTASIFHDLNYYYDMAHKLAKLCVSHES